MNQQTIGKFIAQNITELHGGTITASYSGADEITFEVILSK